MKASLDGDPYFHHSGNMEQKDAAHALSTLGHPDRLDVFRLLMRFAPQGVRPTEIAAALGLKQNTLSHHLAELAAGELIHVNRRGRSLYYAANLDTAERLLRYLALDVGRARPELVSPLVGKHQRPFGFNVLFICSGNSARSIFAEALLRDLGHGKFQAFSAGTRPNTQLNPHAVEILRRSGHDSGALRSKHISEFQGPASPSMDFVFTVCDAAAAEECPPWPDQPIAGHWGVPDPAKATGTEAQKALAFAETYTALRHRIAIFVALPFDALNRISLQSRVDAIGMDPFPKGQA